MFLNPVQCVEFSNKILTHPIGRLTHDSVVVLGGIWGSNHLNMTCKELQWCSNSN